ncbi:hypothetical protein GMPD_37530 [Geomonas paludis]|uniref:Uncharacterized protein n=1 Tax=Geomonas paludis TaxID=2740185 RepID=A0A6V8N198_9BACT|nr:hypothetical protein GMPD_37530 [Geomonas paludis]
MLPLPLGEGWGEGASYRGYAGPGASNRPWHLPHPAFGHPLPEGEGMDWANDYSPLQVCARDPEWVL